MRKLINSTNHRWEENATLSRQDQSLITGWKKINGSICTETLWVRYYRCTTHQSKISAKISPLVVTATWTSTVKTSARTKNCWGSDDESECKHSTVKKWQSIDINPHPYLLTIPRHIEEETQKSAMAPTRLWKNVWMYEKDWMHEKPIAAHQTW